MLKQHFFQLAAYNRWANARLYAAALALDEGAYRRDVGAFFKSLHGTLNHLLVVDRGWMSRLTGGPGLETRLDAIVCDSRRDLTLARIEQDQALIAYVAGLGEPDLDVVVTYKNSKGTPFAQSRADILAHLFNHQTHHRGQAHTILSLLTGQEPPVLDLLAMQRQEPAPDLTVQLQRQVT